MWNFLVFRFVFLLWFEDQAARARRRVTGHANATSVSLTDETYRLQEISLKNLVHSRSFFVHKHFARNHRGENQWNITSNLHGA